MPAQPTTDQRREIEELVCDLPGGRPGEMAFEEPWEIRAFALAVSAHKEGRFPWSAFQGALIDSIKKWEEGVDDLRDPSWSYYRHWVEALEKVLVDTGSLDPIKLEENTREILSTPPNRDHQKAHLDPIAVDPARH